MRKMWGGRFSREAGRMAEGFTSSLPFDKALWRYDLTGSRAHVRMLQRQGIIEPLEAGLILKGLDDVERELEEGRFLFRRELEDIHLNIEARLTESIGPTGGRLHTARSRNDQVSLDMHLYVMDEIRKVSLLVIGLAGALMERAKGSLGAVVPGYTHLQRAQPVLLSHHFMAYFWMLERDLGRLRDCRERADMMPLGAAALAGTGFDIDPVSVASEMGFRRLYQNSMDAVSDRDYILEFLACLSLIMVHISRLAEELILWSTQEFGFIEMDDSYSTGSSIMPQKKNPDVAELGRGKSGRVFGSLMALLTMVKGLPLTYSSDLQEDKEGTFDAVATVKNCLTVFTGMILTLRIDEECMAKASREGFIMATELADYLARKGVPFREAHHVVGGMVRDLVASGKGLCDLRKEDLLSYHQSFGPDALDVLDPSRAVDSRRSPMGTAKERVLEQIVKAEAFLESQERFWLHKTWTGEQNT